MNPGDGGGRPRSGPSRHPRSAEPPVTGRDGSVLISAHSTPLPARSREEVLRILEAADDADGVTPLDEATRLDLREPYREVTHLVAHDPEGVIAGYAWTDGTSGELVVDPGHRRRGYGRSILTEVLEVAPDTALWAHGDLPAAAALAATRAMARTRELWRMRWSGGATPPDPGSLPDGYAVRSFEGPANGPDGTALIAANARIFADHPEQGAFSVDDLARRMSEPWFDPRLLRLVEFGDPGADRGAAGEASGAAETPSGAPQSGTGLAAFAWVKPAPRPGDDDEIYLVGVGAEHRRRGLSTWLVRDAQDSAIRRGREAMVLYVEGANAPAIRSYLAADFHQDSVDVQYSVVR